MKKRMHILIYIGVAILALFLIVRALPFFLWGGLGFFAQMGNVPRQENVLSSYTCGDAQLSLIHYYENENSFELGPSEGLLFEFTNNGTSTRTTEITSRYPGWQSQGFPLYMAPIVQLKTFAGFTFEYKQARAWNILMIGGANADGTKSASVLKADQFAQFSDCLSTHAKEINSTLKAFKPRISDNADRSPLMINSIANTYINARDISLHTFSCGSSTYDGLTYKVTMEKEGNGYHPKVAPYAEYETEEKNSPEGYWMVHSPEPSQGALPLVENIRACKNMKGEALGMYIDEFNKSIVNLNLPQ